MTQAAWTRHGQPVDANDFTGPDWESLKLSTQLGDFVLPCCKAPAVLKTSINGLPFFAHLSDECATAPQTKWHREGKAAVLAALNRMGLEGREEVPGKSSTGDKWEADVQFGAPGRTIVIELQRSYQHLRDFKRRQERYAASGVECYWLLRGETFGTLAKATLRELWQRESVRMPPWEALGTGMLPELPAAMLALAEPPVVHFGQLKSATIPAWLEGILDGTYSYRSGTWNLG